MPLLLEKGRGRMGWIPIFIGMEVRSDRDYKELTRHHG
jgi:hypothetical protein